MLVSDRTYVLTALGARARDELALAAGVRPREVVSVAVELCEPVAVGGLWSEALLVVARHDMPASRGTCRHLVSGDDRSTSLVAADGSVVRLSDAAQTCVEEAVDRLQGRPTVMRPPVQQWAPEPEATSESRLRHALGRVLRVRVGGCA